MEDIRASIGSLRAIRAQGVKIAIDDFGIDIGEGPEGLALVSTIINLAHSMKLNVPAQSRRATIHSD
jgi:EAL domain-containing protein (putative c-di-GMP-specific phosphodiesterase class I)